MAVTRWAHRIECRAHRHRHHPSAHHHTSRHDSRRHSSRLRSGTGCVPDPHRAQDALPASTSHLARHSDAASPGRTRRSHQPALLAAQIDSRSAPAAAPEAHRAARRDTCPPVAGTQRESLAAQTTTAPRFPRHRQPSTSVRATAATHASPRDLHQSGYPMPRVEALIPHQCRASATPLPTGKRMNNNHLAILLRRLAGTMASHLVDTCPPGKVTSRMFPQSPNEIPVARAVRTMSWFGSTRFTSRSASTIGIVTIFGECRATM